MEEQKLKQSSTTKSDQVEVQAALRNVSSSNGGIGSGRASSNKASCRCRCPKKAQKKYTAGQGAPRGQIRRF